MLGVEGEPLGEGRVGKGVEGAIEDPEGRPGYDENKSDTEGEGDEGDEGEEPVEGVEGIEGVEGELVEGVEGVPVEGLPLLTPRSPFKMLSRLLLLAATFPFTEN